MEKITKNAAKNHKCTQLLNHTAVCNAQRGPCNLMNVHVFWQNVKRDQQILDETGNNTLLYLSFTLVSLFSPSSLWTWYSATYSCLSIIFGIGRISVPNSCSILCSENLTKSATAAGAFNQIITTFLRGWINIFWHWLIIFMSMLTLEIKYPVIFTLQEPLQLQRWKKLDYCQFLTLFLLNNFSSIHRPHSIQVNLC